MESPLRHFKRVGHSASHLDEDEKGEDSPDVSQTLSGRFGICAGLKLFLHRPAIEARTAGASHAIVSVSHDLPAPSSVCRHYDTQMTLVMILFM